jgi:hypothetical protein
MAWNTRIPDTSLAEDLEEAAECIELAQVILTIDAMKVHGLKDAPTATTTDVTKSGRLVRVLREHAKRIGGGE